MHRRWLLLVTSVLAACGANVVFDEDGAGGSSTTNGSTTGGTVTTGGGACDDHADCAPFLCIFGTGQCASPCTAGACETCGPGRFCEACATSSCPECDDCLAACVDLAPGRCDDDDACPPDSVCAYAFGTCLPACGGDGDCGEFEFCDTCATGSCCGCKDCVGACVGGR